MNTTKMESKRSLADEMAEDLKRVIATGEVAADAFLPTERDLGERYQVSRVTVRRSLSRLVAEGILESIPHRGYRPAAKPSGRQTRKVAYVLDIVETGEAWDRAHEQILTAFQRTLITDGAIAYAVGCKGRNPQQLFQELVEARVWGVMLDSSRAEILDAAAASGLPCVVVNSATDRTDLDVVIQDNFNGVRLGVEYLIAQGHKKIGWIGRMGGSAHAAERFAGYLTALRSAKLEPPADFLVDPDSLLTTPALEEKLAHLMQRTDAPTAFAAPWMTFALGFQSAIQQARQAGAKVPALLAWGNEREYREVLAPECLGGLMPATLVWRPGDMAELALERLRTRAEKRPVPTSRIDVKIELVPPQPAEEALKNFRLLKRDR